MTLTDFYSHVWLLMATMWKTTRTTVNSSPTGQQA